AAVGDRGYVELIEIRPAEAERGWMRQWKVNLLTDRPVGCKTDNCPSMHQRCPKAALRVEATAVRRGSKRFGLCKDPLVAEDSVRIHGIAQDHPWRAVADVEAAVERTDMRPVGDRQCPTDLGKTTISSKEVEAAQRILPFGSENMHRAYGKASIRQHRPIVQPHVRVALLNPGQHLFLAVAKPHDGLLAADDQPAVTAQCERARGRLELRLEDRLAIAPKGKDTACAAIHHPK